MEHYVLTMEGSGLRNAAKLRTRLRNLCNFVLRLHRDYAPGLHWDYTFVIQELAIIFTVVLLTELIEIF